jgi:hypothetical protein
MKLGGLPPSLDQLGGVSQRRNFPPPHTQLMPLLHSEGHQQLSVIILQLALRA